MEKNKRKKIILFIAVMFVSLIFLSSFTSCALLGGNGNANSSTAASTETYTVKMGDVVESISANGYVYSSETKTYSNQVSGEVLEVLSVGTSFKEGDVLLQIKDEETPLLISQSEINLKTAETSLKESKLSYQNALDANHVAIQLADLDTVQSEQASQNALASLENSNASASASIDSAVLSAENADATASASLKSAKIALATAQHNYDYTKADSSSTSDEVYQAKQSLKSAQAAYDKALVESENNASSAGIDYEQAKLSAQSKVASAETTYQDALNNQSKGYWNNLSSLESTKLKISTASLAIVKAQAQVELSKISIEIAKLNIGNNEIIAPFDGIVLSSDYDQGGTAKEESTIAIINNSFVIKTDINETDINKIEVGQEVEITLDAYSDQIFKGEVTKKSSISENNANVITFEITVTPDESAASSLLYGLSANLTIIEESAQNVLYVPTGAVYKQNGKQYVDVVTATTEELTSENISQYTKPVEVTTGISNYNYIEIKSGIKEGDVIMASRAGSLSGTSDTGNTGDTTPQSNADTGTPPEDGGGAPPSQ